MLNKILLVLFYLYSQGLAAQSLKDHVNVLAGNAMKGRGYIDGGVDSAASYISKQFQSIHLHPFPKADGYYQHFKMPVNTFPGNVSFSLNGKALTPGVDFVVHAASKNIHVQKENIQTLSLAAVKNTRQWRRTRRHINAGQVVILHDIDTVFKYTKSNIRRLAYSLKKGVYIVPLKGRLHWLACSKLADASVIYIKDSVLPRVPASVKIDVETNFIRSFETKNVGGYVPGTANADSVIVFTAHYDHLGEMGKELMFPGANDNASGVAILLDLAEYYSSHPAKYSVAFIAFSGEEAGLKGSKYFVKHPLVPLKKIRFLVNLDIAGDATNGITVVNAPAYPNEFALLEKINNNKNYLPKVLKRDQTKNSDHYPFSKKHVRAIYIYANGIKPYYHDIYDKPEEINFENAEGFIRLLRDFVDQLH